MNNSYTTRIRKTLMIQLVNAYYVNFFVISINLMLKNKLAFKPRHHQRLRMKAAFLLDELLYLFVWCLAFRALFSLSASCRHNTLGQSVGTIVGLLREGIRTACRAEPAGICRCGLCR